jgi:hypothetical protein
MTLDQYRQRRARAVLQVIAVLCILPAASPAEAQSVPVGDPLEDYARLLQLTGALPVSAVSAGPAAEVGGLLTPVEGKFDPWRSSLGVRLPAATGRDLRFDLLPFEFRTAYNSARPWGFNDGAMWQGRGTTLGVSGGLAARWGRISAAFRPVMLQNQNRAFELSPLPVRAGQSSYSYPTGTGLSIDMPQRFGAESYSTFDLGQSFVRGDFGPVAVGLSNENLWWGPGRRNGIIMSNHGPGMGHVFLGTARPADVRIGTFETRWIWGRLRESQYFDSVATNDSRFFTGIVATFSPKFLAGLELGLSRTFVNEWREGGPSLEEITQIFIPLEKNSFVTPEAPTGNDRADQMATLFFRWALPESGFELYGEWAKGDHSRDWRDLFVEVEHASGWMLGAQKVVAADAARVWRIATELTLLGASRTSLLRAPSSPFYVHPIVRQGYTQRGQVIGAGIGPGSSQFSFGVDRFATWGKTGLGFLRTVYDNDRFYAEPRSHHTHEVEPSFTADLLLYRGRWDLSGAVTTSNLLNKWYIERNDERNLNLNFSARYHFGAR